MARLYCSFLLRYWRIGSGDERIEIEHIQSGERTHVTSLAAAIDWIEARGSSPPATPPIPAAGSSDYHSGTSGDDLP